MAGSPLALCAYLCRLRRPELGNGRVRDRIPIASNRLLRSVTHRHVGVAERYTAHRPESSRDGCCYPQDRQPGCPVLPGGALL